MELPKDIGGYQHLEPWVVTEAGDIFAQDGKPVCFVNSKLLGMRVESIQDRNIGYNVYRKIPVAKQSDAHERDYPVAESAQILSEALRISEPPPAARAIGCSALPTDAAKRKATPIYSGFLKYFPRACAEVARVSQAGNDQHNPGKPLHWDRSKSGDELDAASRHLLEAGTLDSDGQRHSAKLAWRAMANLEKELEAAE